MLPLQCAAWKEENWASLDKTQIMSVPVAAVSKVSKVEMKKEIKQGFCDWLKKLNAGVLAELWKKKIKRERENGK